MNTPANDQNKRWLVIFLIYADFTTNEKLPMIEKMKVTLNNLLGEIKTTPLNKNKARMYVIMNSIKIVAEDGTNKPEDKTLFYTIKNEKGMLQNEIICEVIDNKAERQTGSNHSLQKTERLTAILNRTGVSDDEEILLVTWDHGSAFGIFRQEEVATGTDMGTIRTEIDKELDQYPFLNMFWQLAPKDIREGSVQDKKGVTKYRTVQYRQHLIKFEDNEFLSFVSNSKKSNRLLSIKKNPDNTYRLMLNREIMADHSNPALQSPPLPERTMLMASLPADKAKVTGTETASEILKNGELAGAIEAWLMKKKQKKVSVLLMTNCWMMNLHTMYALRNTVQYLVAPQGNIDCPGYNYRDILQLINDEKTSFLPPEDLAVQCVKTCENDFAKARAGFLNTDEPDTIDEWKVFAVKLDKQSSAKQTVLEFHIDLLDQLFKVLLSEIEESESENPPLSPELKFLLKYVRSVCFDFSENHVMMVDIINWMLSIKFANEPFEKGEERVSQVIRAQIITIIPHIFNEKKSLIIESTGGKNIYASGRETIPTAVINLPPRAYSIFFPMLKFDNVNLIDNVVSDELLTEKLKSWTAILSRLDRSLADAFKTNEN